MEKKIKLTNWSGTLRILISNSGSLIGTTAISSMLGFFYWWVAAHQFSPEAVGLASAAISLMLLLGTFGILGFGTLLIGMLPNYTGDKISLIITVVVFVSIAAGILGLFFILVASLFSSELSIWSANLGNITLFIVGVSLTAIVIVIDQSFIGLLRGNLQFYRNSIFAISKLGLLLLMVILFEVRTGKLIYLVWALGNIISLLILFTYLVSFKNIKVKIRPQWKFIRRLGSTAFSHHILNLALQTPGFALPVLVAVLLSSKINAYFYVAWMIASFSFVVPIALTTVLYAMSVSDPDTLFQKIKITLLLSLFIGIVSFIGLYFVSSNILIIFGNEYAEHASWGLRILGFAVFPIAIKTHYVAIYRIYGQVSKAAKIMSLLAILELVCAALGAIKWGLAGLCAAWTLALCFEALFMLRLIIKTTFPVNVNGIGNEEEDFALLEM